jgi:hypothetical protein
MEYQLWFCFITNDPNDSMGQQFPIKTSKVKAIRDYAKCVYITIRALMAIWIDGKAY